MGRPANILEQIISFRKNVPFAFPHPGYPGHPCELPLLKLFLNILTIFVETRSFVFLNIPIIFGERRSSVFFSLAASLLHN
jgi:hypothetical protein